MTLGQLIFTMFLLYYWFLLFKVNYNYLLDKWTFRLLVSG